MDTLSEVGEEGVETVFSRNEKVRSTLQGMRELNQYVLSCYQQIFYVITIRHHGRCEKEQPNMEMLKIELL